MDEHLRMSLALFMGAYFEALTVHVSVALGHSTV